MARRMRRSFRAGKSEYIWSAIQIDDQPFALTVTSGNIVDSTDWADDGGFVRGGVLERIRGTLSVYATGTTNARGVGWMGISVLNSGETVANPGDVADYVEEDMLWQRCHAIATNTATAVGFDNHHGAHFEVDVKARRKLTTNTIVQFGYIATVAVASMRISGMLRALIRKP